MLNDVTARDWQYRTTQWHQGKTFEATTPIGPWLVTADDPAVAAQGLSLTCEVDGDTVQKADTGDLVFDPATLVAYLSEIITLVPGDVIATGTPGGVGHARKPARYLQDGTRLVTRIEGDRRVPQHLPPGDAVSARPEPMLEWAAKGTAAFEAAVHWLTDSGITRPSYLPGWSRAHVVAHVARNADALVNLLTWARTGVETPMYASPDQRTNEIEDGARQPAGALRADLLAADGRLAEELAASARPVLGCDRTDGTGTRSARHEVPWMRVREVWVHTVDLDISRPSTTIPHEVCAALVDDVATAFLTHPDCPARRAADRGRRPQLAPGRARRRGAGRGER